MKKFLSVTLIFISVLFSVLFVSAESTPITHTYLSQITDSGEYVFETVISPSSTIMCKPIIAMYDSRNALCGLTIGNNAYIQKSAVKSLTIKVTPWKTPVKIKLMLWDSSGSPVPKSQFEVVPTAVCDKNFGSIANISLTGIQSKNYTFETVLNSPVNASYTPVIRMYDASGNICGFKEFESISLAANKSYLKEFEVYSSVTPSRISFTLRNGTDVGQFTDVPVSVSPEKIGVIMDADSSKGVKLFATDGTYNYYDFSENFVLSYGNTVVSNKQTAYDYINGLRLKSYNRMADTDTDNDGKVDSWTPVYHWQLFFSNEERYGQIIPSAYYPIVLDDSCRLDYSDFLNNYAKRMVRVLVSPDGKITSMSLPGDNLFRKITAGKAYSEVFYDHENMTFSNELNINENAAIIYLPTKKTASESDFKALSIDGLNKGNLYHLKEYTTKSGKQIILITYMLSESEIASFNVNPIKHISTALNGNGSTAPGIKNHMFSISLTNQPITNNDKANKLANDAMAYVAKGLEGALNGANQGYALTKNYIRAKFANEIDAAKKSIKELQAIDTQYNASYYNELKNEISNVVEGNALAFLEEYFLN